MKKEKYKDKNGNEVTRLKFGKQKREKSRKEIYTDIKEFELLKEHLKPIGVSPSSFITNIIKTTNREIEKSGEKGYIKINFGIDYE